MQATHWEKLKALSAPLILHLDLYSIMKYTKLNIHNFLYITSFATVHVVFIIKLKYIKVKEKLHYLQFSLDFNI
jgi:hypothetical protein